MKKLFMLVMILVLSTSLLMGCNQKEDETREADAEPEPMATVEIITVETLMSTDGYSLILGSLLEKEDDTITIKTKDNYELTFKLAPETVIYAGTAAELLAGEEIAVVFEGELVGLNTDGVMVITVSITEEELEEEPEEVVEVAVTKGIDGYYQVSGVVTDATMNTITVLTQDDYAVTFYPNDDTRTNYIDGLTIDDVITVAFEGDLSGTDTSQVTVKWIMEEGYMESLNRVSGAVTDAATDTITILTDEDQKITFAINDNTIATYVGGLTIEDRVEIAYEGELMDTKDLLTIAITVTKK